MWDIHEGAIDSLNVVKLVLPKDLGFRDPKVSKVLGKLSMQTLLCFLVLGEALRVRGADCKGEDTTPLSSLEHIIIEQPIPNQDLIGNLQGAIISIRLGLISCVVKIRFHFFTASKD